MSTQKIYGRLALNWIKEYLHFNSQANNNNEGSGAKDDGNIADEYESIAEMSAVNDFVEDLKRNLQPSSKSKKT